MHSDSTPPAVDGLDAAKLIAGALSPVSSPAFAWDPPPVAHVAPWFPDYEVQSLAGRGSMGAVYRALQRKLQRPVAIKLLPPALAAREGAVARFEREARAMAQLNHPNLVALHDYGRTAEGHLYIVMEYVDGADLSRLIHVEGGGLSVPQALEIVTQVCDALQYAHSRGLVHRDIKPGNVLVDRDGRVKIADFGLAKLLGDNPRNSAATMTGTVLGTPDYTAPEQLKGGTVDHRADIYSLGVMFYEMLTGELPRGAWEPPSKLTPAASVRLDEVVTRAMQSEPDKRYQQASEVKLAVEGAKDSAPAPDTGRSKKPPLLTNKVLFWLMAVCFVWMAFVTPTGDMLSLLMIAGPFLLLAVFFVIRRKPAGAVSAFLAGMALCFAVVMTILSGQWDGEPAKTAGESPEKMETISSVQAGRVAEIKVKPGQQIPAGSVVAVMDSAPLKTDLELWRGEVLSRWGGESAECDRQIATLEAELRQTQTAEAEDSATIKEIGDQMARLDESVTGAGTLGNLMRYNVEYDRNRLELAKAKSRDALRAPHLAQIQESMRDLKTKRDDCAKSSDSLRAARLTDETVIPLLPLSPEEHRRYQQLLMALEGLYLKAARQSLVVRVMKAPGETVKAGEAVAVLEVESQP